MAAIYLKIYELVKHRQSTNVCPSSQHSTMIMSGEFLHNFYVSKAKIGSEA